MQVILQKIGDGLGKICLSNGKSNLLDQPNFMDQASLESFLSDPELKGVIVQGQGRHFCAGADLNQLAQQRQDQAVFLSDLAAGKLLLDTINRSTIPVLALIRGSCLGAGLEIALACHFRFAATHALLGFPETQHGFIPGMGGSVFGQAALQKGPLVDLVLSGRCVLGPEALQLGLVDRVGENADLEVAAIAYLRELTGRHSPKLIRLAMACINDGRFLPRAVALERESQRFFELMQGAEFGND